MGEEYQMTIWEAPKSGECEDVGETNLQPPLPYPDDINKTEETTIVPKNESVTEIISINKMDDTNDSIDTINTIQSVNSPAIFQISNEIQNETMQKQIIPKEYAYVISELWKTMDNRPTMELRNVHNRLKQITHSDLTTGQVGKYLKYCKAVEIKNRKKRYQYLPDRDKWTLSESEQIRPLRRDIKNEGFVTYANAVFMADEERESRIYEDYLSRKEESTETE